MPDAQLNMKTQRLFLLLLLILGLPASFDAIASPADADWDAGNLIANGDFSKGSASGLPKGWTAVRPNPAIAPEFKLDVSADGCRTLAATGNGREECFGYVRQRVRIAGGKSYRMRVRFHAEGLDDLNRHLIHGVYGQFSDGIFAYRREGTEVVGENVFAGPEKAQDAEVRLYFRYSPTGKVRWEQVSLQECPPLPARPVKIACSWGRGDMLWWSKWLDAAGEKKADVALLLENFNGKGPNEPETSNGPSATLLSEKARQWHMYVTGTYYERRDGLVYNTARLFDREGKLAGIYSKMQIYEPEPEEGVTPGKELPVFDTDFGRVGIMICYDSWFPEVARLLAYKGAELVLFPSAGYYPALMPARAADNGLCIAASSANDIPGIWDSSGALA